MLFDVKPFLVRGHERMPFFYGGSEKARGLDRHHGLINRLLFCVGRLCDECYDIALLKPFEELFDGVLGIPSRGPDSLIGCFSRWCGTAVPCGEAIEDGARAVTRLDIDNADPCWIGASLETLGDGAVELGIDGSAQIRLRFVDDAIRIVCDGRVCLFLAGEGPLGDDTASDSWHIDCHWSMVAWVHARHCLCICM